MGKHRFRLVDSQRKLKQLKLTKCFRDSEQVTSVLILSWFSFLSFLGLECLDELTNTCYFCCILLEAERRRSRGWALSVFTLPILTNTSISSSTFNCTNIISHCRIGGPEFLPVPTTPFLFCTWIARRFDSAARAVPAEEQELRSNWDGFISTGMF